MDSYNQICMNKLTSVTIACNEAPNIGRCIESLLEAADEIIVLIDNKTTDKTEAIVASYPGVIYRVVEWQGYSRTKQAALDLATHKWILWLDADEELTTSLRDEIIQLKNADFEAFSAYAIPRRALFLGRWIYHSGWYPGYVTRLFNKELVKLSENAVHEHLIINTPVGRLKSDLNHYTDPSIEHYFMKFNNYTTLAAKDLTVTNKTFSLIDIIIRPPFLFVKMYILKLGFLDGLQGFLLAVFSALYVFTKYAKLWELNHKKGNK